MEEKDPSKIREIQNMNHFVSLTKGFDRANISYESGIEFNTTINFGDESFIENKKTIPLENKDETMATYKKVVDVYELNQEEINQVNKFKQFWKDIYNRLTKNGKYKLHLLFMLAELGATFYFANNDHMFSAIFFGVLFGVDIADLNEVFKKYIHYEKKKEEKTADLRDMGIYNDTIVMDSPNDVSMYIKVKRD